jgi:hypothetical protein
MKQHAINNRNDFICGWYTDQNDLCDDIISYFKNSDKVEGTVVEGIKKDVKDSLDVALKGDLVEKYVQTILKPCTDLYVEKFPMCNFYSPWSIVDSVNVQYYKPGAGFHAWHTERTNGHQTSTSRHLVFMTYLNDVNEGGETEWLHQKLKIKPEKGLTVIWVPDWTFTHRGLVSTEDKYIVTGWYNFI